MPTKEQAAKIAANNISTKFFRLQPEYMGTRRIRVTVCNVPAIITGEVLASFLSSYGRVEEVNLLRSSAGTAYGEYIFRLCLTREGFQAIPEIITFRDRQMMVVVEDRRPRCWGCKQPGHIANFCPQKEQSATTKTTTTASTTATTEAAIRTEGAEKGQVPNDPKSDEGWKEVARKKGKKGNHPKVTASASQQTKKAPVRKTPKTLNPSQQQQNQFQRPQQIPEARLNLQRPHPFLLQKLLKRKRRRLLLQNQRRRPWRRIRISREEGREERALPKRSAPTPLLNIIHWHDGATSPTFPISRKTTSLPSKTTILPSTTKKPPSCSISSLTYPLLLLLLSGTISP